MIPAPTNKQIAFRALKHYLLYSAVVWLCIFLCHFLIVPKMFAVEPRELSLATMFVYYAALPLVIAVIPTAAYLTTAKKPIAEFDKDPILPTFDARTLQGQKLKQFRDEGAQLNSVLVKIKTKDGRIAFVDPFGKVEWKPLSSKQ